MPQLHDSTNHARHGHDGTTSAELFTPARIFGIETEYGLSVTGAQDTGTRPKALEPAGIAMTMFEPVVRRARSTNTFERNGSRLYVDVGAHPEYATAEARTPFDALLYDLAGEQTMRAMAASARDTLAQRYGTDLRIHVFKNNVDSAGHAFGCHENYLVRRFVDLDTIRAVLLPFLISRQIYTGAGRYDHGTFHYTQRATFVDETVSSATTRSRPMINTRDEPHADPDSYRRLHVIIGDSNRSQWATVMKLATTHVVLCALEYGARHYGGSQPLLAMALADPVGANLAVDRDGAAAVLELADGRSITALEMQQQYCSTVREFLDHHKDVVEHAWPASTAADGTVIGLDWTMHEWNRVLELLATNNMVGLAQCADWAAKRLLLDGAARRYGHDHARLTQLDMDYHDVADGSLYEALVRHGRMRVIAGAQDVARASREPLPGTRAMLRGQFVAAAQEAGLRWSCDWTSLTLLEPHRMTCTLIDPFGSTPDSSFSELMAHIQQ